MSGPNEPITGLGGFADLNTTVQQYQPGYAPRKQKQSGFSWMPQLRSGGGMNWGPGGQIGAMLTANQMRPIMDAGAGMMDIVNNGMGSIIQGNADRAMLNRQADIKNALIAAVIGQMGRLGQGQAGTGPGFGGQPVPSMNSNIVPQPIYNPQQAGQIAQMNNQAATSAGNLYNSVLPQLGQAATTNTQMPTGINFTQNGQRMGGATIGAGNGVPGMGGMGQGGVTGLGFTKQHIFDKNDAAKMNSQFAASQKALEGVLNGGDPGKASSLSDYGRALSNVRRSKAMRAGYQAQSKHDLETDLAAAAAQNKGNSEIASMYGLNLNNILQMLKQRVGMIDNITRAQGGSGMYA